MCPALLTAPYQTFTYISYLLADLSQIVGEWAGFANPASCFAFGPTGLPKAMLALLKERDHDLQEKTLEGMRTLMEKTPAAIDAFKQTNGVEEVKQVGGS